MPVRALILSLAALAVPVVWALFFPDRAGNEVDLLLWLTALIPAYLFTHYRGWEGAALALAAGMALLASVQVILLVAGFPPPDWSVLLVVVLVYLVVSLGMGFVRERLYGERNETRRVALTDPLTRLPNRRQARIFLDAGIAAAHRGTPLSVVLLDVERAGDVDGRFGHSVGDDLLRLVADSLMENSRRTDLTARWGGEEFLAVLADSESDGAVRFTHRLRRALADVADRRGRIGLSAGIAGYATGMESPEILLAAADRALYRAKDGDLDRVAVASEGTPAGPGPARPRAQDDPGDEPPETILVVVEDDQTRRELALSLENDEYGVLDAPSAEAALHHLEATGERPDLVVTDVIMGGMSAFALVDRIQARQGRVAVLYTSRYAHENLSWGGVPGSPWGFLTKPVGVEELGARVREMLDAPGEAESTSPSTASTQ